MSAVITILEVNGLAAFAELMEVVCTWYKTTFLHTRQSY